MTTAPTSPRMTQSTRPSAAPVQALTRTWLTPTLRHRACPSAVLVVARISERPAPAPLRRCTTRGTSNLDGAWCSDTTRIVTAAVESEDSTGLSTRVRMAVQCGLTAAGAQPLSQCTDDNGDVNGIHTNSALVSASFSLLTPLIAALIVCAFLL